MSVPTIASVTPTLGHTGGGTLVEITGTGFALPPAPVLDGSGPPAAPAPSVAVSFGGEPCDPEDVAVLSSTQIRVLTPIHDPAGQDASIPASNPNDPPTPVPAADVVVQNLDANGDPVAGELVTASAVFSFVRPNLATPSLTARAMQALVIELRRQVLREVSFNPHTEFDPQTGDALNICKFASLPAVAIVDLKMPASEAMAAYNTPREVKLSDGTTLVLRPSDVRDLVFTLVGASNNQLELLTLEETLCGFFRKNGYLRVARDPNDPSRGFARFVMRQVHLVPVEFTGRTNDNLVAFTMVAAILAVPRYAVPGLPAAGAPTFPGDINAEGGRSIDFPAENFRLTFVQKERT